MAKEITQSMFRGDDQETRMLPAGGNGTAEAGFPQLPGGGLMMGMNLGFLLRHKWLAIAVTLLLAIPGGAAAWLLTKPMYSAGAVIEVSPTIQRIIESGKGGGAVPFYQQYLNSQVAEILGPTVLNRVLDHPDVLKTTWYTQPRRNPLGGSISSLERLRKDLSVGPRRNTSLIDVRMSGPRPAELALIINTVVDEYLKRVLEKSTESRDDVLEAVTQEYKRLQVEIAGLDGEVAGLCRRLGFSDPESALSKRGGRLDEKRDELRSLEDQIKIAEWKRDAVRTSIETGAEPDPEAMEVPETAELKASYESDEQWKVLKQHLRDTENQLELQRNLGEEHPHLIRLRQQLAQARKDLGERETELDRAWAARTHGWDDGGANTPPEAVLQTLNGRIKELTYAGDLKRKEIQSLEGEIEEAALLAGELRAVLGDKNHKQDEYDLVRDRKRTMELERRAPASIRPLARANPPTEPTNQKKRLMLVAMALFGAAGLGLVAAYLRGSTSRLVHHVEEISANAPLPFLGDVPTASEDRLADDPAFSESIRIVRTALLQRVGSTKGAVIQITSAGPGAGKTTLTVELARSLVRCGKRVLIVDTDFYHPSLHKRCDVSEQPGLYGMLANGMDDSAAIRNEPREGFSILTAGRLDDQADSELLANGLLKKRLQRWRGQYDIILLDSPPLLPLADARILAQHATGTVFVVRKSHCHRADLAEAFTCLSAAGGKLLGTVFVGGSWKAGYRSTYLRSRLTSYVVPEAVVSSPNP